MISWDDFEKIVIRVGTHSCWQLTFQNAKHAAFLTHD
jgi:hypothetical protein